MDDSTTEIKKKYREMILQKTGTERIIMGASMTEAAKVMTLSSIERKMSATEKRIHLFLRFYYNDFSKTERAEIIDHLKLIKHEIGSKKTEARKTQVIKEKGKKEFRLQEIGRGSKS